MVVAGRDGVGKAGSLPRANGDVTGEMGGTGGGRASQEHGCRLVGAQGLQSKSPDRVSMMGY